MRLAELNTFDLDPSKKYTYVVSLGALEQHGPYAPLGTDTFAQDAMMQRVEQALPDILFLPTIPVGPSYQHLGFMGTISLRPETLHAILTDIVESLQANAQTIFFVSWHGGNKPTTAEFIKTGQAKFPDTKLAMITFGDEGTDALAEKLLGGPVDDHAGNTEVSVMLAAQPDITKQPELGSTKRTIDFGWDKRIIEVTPEGVIDSNPNWVASSQIGQELIKIYADNLIRKIRQFQG
jgi:creatinine amidohydrolase